MVTASADQLDLASYPSAAIRCCLYLQHDDPWKVRVLPRVAFGVHPSDDEELGPHLPGVVVLHHFLGSWQWQGSWARHMPAHRTALQIMSPLLPKGWVR
jgi:hypothetical protein